MNNVRFDTLSQQLKKDEYEV